MVKASEPERIETYLLLRRCETISTVTTVSKLVDLLASTSSGETLSDFINIGVVTKGLKRGGFSRSSVDQHCWHDRVDESFKRDRKLRTSTKRHTACTDGFVGDGQPRSEVPKKLHGVSRTHGEGLAREPTNMYDLARTTEAKASLARAKTKGSKSKARLARAKASQKQRKR